MERLSWVMVTVALSVVGCATTGNSLTMGSKPEFEVFDYGEHGYLLRYNGGGSPERQSRRWHSKAKEICGSDNYEGGPKIQTFDDGMQSAPIIVPTGGGVMFAGTQNYSGSHQVAAGRLVCGGQKRP